MDCPATAKASWLADDNGSFEPFGRERSSKGILSRTLFSDDRLKAVLFGFAQSEELSEHTASLPAVLHFLQGEAKLTLGDDTVEAKPGTWIHMAKGLRHSIQAKTPVVMLLLLVK
jgi:quercetin dioxygenase-like cupin family protein